MIRKKTEPKNPSTNPQPNQKTPEVVLPTVRAKEKKIISLGPRTEENTKSYDITRKNLRRLISHQNNQTTYAKVRKSPGGGPDQNAHRMAERLNTYMDVVILPEGGPGYVRNMKIPFKARHGEAHMTREQIEKKRLKEKEREENGKPRFIPQGQMLEHIRQQKKRFLGREERKYIQGHRFGMRLARARDLLIKESIPKIRPSVLIKAKEGRAAYVRDNPRLKRALTAFKHTIRSQRPLDERINRDFGPYPTKPDEDITLVQIHSEASDEEIDQDPTPTTPMRSPSRTSS